jgi:hypothetical protein
VERLGALARETGGRIEARAIDDAAGGLVDLRLAGLLERRDVEAGPGLRRRRRSAGLGLRLGAGLLALGGGDLLLGDEARGGELGLEVEHGASSIADLGAAHTT